MDKNALTEKRRETVLGLLKGMDIKKAGDGGFEKKEVLDCMQKLCDLYEKNIEELQNDYEAEILGLKEKYQKYDENNELYVSLIMEAKKSSNDIINQAKSEVETILEEGKEKIAKQEEELRLLYEGVETEKATINEELNASRKAVEAEKLAMKAEVDAEREKCAALKSKYNQQMLSMEEEFMEIKTNVLRTSGKIDSLKSKLTAEETYNWDISDGEDDVDFPSRDVEVEDIIETVPEELSAQSLNVEEAAEENPVAEDVTPIEPEITTEEINLDEIVAGSGEVIDIEQPEANVSEVEIPAEEIDLSDIEDVDLPELEDVDDLDGLGDIDLPDIELDDVDFSDVDFSDVDLPDSEETSEAISMEDIFETHEDVVDGEIVGDGDEINLDDINFDDIDFSELNDDEQEENSDEISFEGIEQLFKEEK